MMLHMVKGDLFSCPPDESLAHCISADCRLGKGIAVMFRNEFGGIRDLRNQQQRKGGLAVLKRGNRFIYNLVTKERSFDKPTYVTMRQSLEKMREHCLKHNVKKVSMPLIGCGLDRLEWGKVQGLLEDIFHDADVAITVYRL